MKPLRYLWALPWSVVGAALSVLFDRRSVVNGVLLAEGARWPGRFGWRYRAITFGHVVLAVDDLDPETMDHEMVHVRQYERWGLLFVPAYMIASLSALLKGGHYYRENRFEVAARHRHPEPR